MTLHTTRTSIALAGAVTAFALLHPCNAYAANNNLICVTDIALAISSDSNAITDDAANNSSAAALQDELALQEINTAVVVCNTEGNTVRDLGAAYASVAFAYNRNVPPDTDPVASDAAEENALTQLNTAKNH